jgi:hypothetical protein
MIPVVLVKLPNNIQFLGTFETTNYAEWWKSNALPGPIDYIVSNEWCYGSAHLCTVKMLDGSYSIYRSIDYGMNWAQTFNVASQIYTLTRIDYGWMLINTDNGWYQSTDTGLTWQLISTGAPQCKTVINVEENTLIAHSGRYVYRSPDVGVTWTQVLDCHLLHVHPYHDPVNYVDYYNNVDCYPALAGVNNRVLVGAGPYLVLSDDTGLNWTIPFALNQYGWRSDELGNPDGASHPPDGRALQIVFTGGTSAVPETNMFMARFYIPLYGSVRNYYSPDGGIHWKSRFDQPFSGYTNGALTSYEVIVQGTDNTQVLVYSSQMGFNPISGTNNPSPKYSTDGGNTWTSLNVDSFKVYEGNPDTTKQYEYGGPFVSENFTNTTWVGYPCHNSGHYNSNGFFRRGISEDLDSLIKAIQKYPYTSNMSTYVTQSHGYGTDSVVMVRRFVPINNNMILEAINNKNLYVWGTIKSDTPNSMPSNVEIVQRTDFAWNETMPLMKTFRYIDWTDVLIRGPLETSYGMDTILVVQRDWGHELERVMPQYPYMDFGTINYEVLDTRKTPILGTDTNPSTS